MNKKALIFGFTGQDGSYLAQFLLSKNYDVYGVVRRVSNPSDGFIKEMGLEQVKLVQGDLGDSNSIYHLMKDIQPDEVYNLGAQSHVGTSFSQPEYTGDVTGLGCLRILEQIRLHSPHSRLYQAGSSEQFGDVQDMYQNEETVFRPRSPYAAAKVYAHHLCKVYRESYGVYASVGLLFNHESPRRSKDFVTRKITSWLGQNGKDLRDFGTLVRGEPLRLGNLDSKRDWGSAKDYVEGMWMMLQQDKPDDYVLATGKAHSVRNFCSEAFRLIGIELLWSGTGVNEVGKSKEGEVLVMVDPLFYRPAEVNFLLGDYSKAATVLGWKPKMKFEDLVKWMVDYDIGVGNVSAPN